MQKKIIALAVAGLVSGAAFAQTNVTIYGAMDLGQAWVSSDGGNGLDGQSTVGRLDNNSSHIGFKGTEDLGNGLKAIFQYESGFTADDAGALAGGRDTYLGLTGGFGTFVMGNLTHPLRAMGSKVELVPAAAGIGTVASVTGTFAGVKTGADDRAKNALAYVSPNFSGFTVTGAYVNGETDPNGANKGEAIQYQLAAAYENGPIYIAGGYHAADNIGGNSDVDAAIWRLAGMYTFGGMFKVTGLYDNTEVDGDDRNAWSLGGAFMTGPHTIGVEYAASDDISNTNKTSSDMYSLVYSYAMSKRTMIHARYSAISNDDHSSANFYNNPVANPSAGNPGADIDGFMVGVRHSF